MYHLSRSHTIDLEEGMNLMFPIIKSNQITGLTESRELGMMTYP